MFTKTVSASLLALGLMASAANAEIIVRDAYIRSAAPTAPTGAAFMELENTGDSPMRLVSASTDIAAKVELHEHREDENGMMMMREIEGGIEIAPGETHLLKRGGDHVMIMGLNMELVQGETVPLTLGFADGTELPLEIEVDRERSPAHGGGMQGHGNMQGHGDMKSHDGKKMSY
ncbi:hypothetical protein FIU97_03215 [Roseivivax sp. THAF40]|uniref:copper chaperone PCu(A)C n=1 Tax=unclassified Roseivivax TaxID=2639302 RepID=UPI001267A8EA|nr:MULTISPECIES: copper chaperone PCu(A)C [unclassified Roseivivax]QFS81777.1 hypothetical protein FIV09_02955 [Roseivivax sp. THAF197b]QFT45577.1 hypothetical protein FIU97_03215 [Roseivivax sp. THAF40]